MFVRSDQIERDSIGIGETFGMGWLSVILPGGLDVAIANERLNPYQVARVLRWNLPALAQVEYEASGARHEVFERDDLQRLRCDDEIRRSCHCGRRGAEDVDANGVFRVDGLQ